MPLVWKILYRIAYYILQVCWFLRGGRPDGAFVAIWCDDRVLLVQTSYQRRHTFPGGGKKRREDPLQAAIRETREEVGIALSPDMLTRVDTEVGAEVFAREGIALYEAHFDSPPEIKIDHREIAFASFFDVFAPETSNLWPLFLIYMDCKRAALEARR